MSWLDELPFDPMAALLETGNPAVRYFARRDLLDEDTGSVTTLWELLIPKAIVRRQQEEGSWAYPGKQARGATNYNQLETYRELGFLIEKFGFDRSHPAVSNAAEYLLSFQTDEGDIRGLYGNQYTPNYSAAMIELMIKAGYTHDDRIARCIQWLIGFRQDDGGWALPFRTVKANLAALEEAETLQLNRSAPFSHLITGIVLRAFAAHPAYVRSDVAQKAGVLLASRLFKTDAYPDKGRVLDWTEFCYPFWTTDLISALDSLSRTGFSAKDRNIEAALSWLAERQDKGGLFRVHMLRDRHHDLALWIALSICRVLRRFHPS